MTSVKSGERIYLWITRWREFQHYAPEPDRAPKWIKDYTKQLDDDAYLALTPVQRGVLHDLRMVFARAHGKLAIGTRETHENTVTGARETRESFATGTRALSHRVGYRVTSVQLEALNHAGFIEFLSRESLESALEQFYSDSSPRARGRTRREEETETEEETEALPQDIQRFALPEPRPPRANNGQPPDTTTERQTGLTSIGQTIDETLAQARKNGGTQ